MPRFVILTHDHPSLHWDFMLEAQSALRTWRLSAALVVSKHIQAELLPDHRLHYLDYEGPVSKNRGTVTRWDAGTFTWIMDEPLLLKVYLQGKRIRGICLLKRNIADNFWTCQIEDEVE